MAFKTRHLKCVGGPLDGQCVDVAIGTREFVVPVISTAGTAGFGQFIYNARTITFGGSLSQFEYLAPKDLDDLFAVRMVFEAYNPERAS